jgi:outer membrane protein assembly factor BamB
MRVITFFLLICLFCVSCKKIELITKIDTNGTTIETPPLWGVSTTDGPHVLSFNKGYIYDGKILTMGSKKFPNQTNLDNRGDEYLMFKDINTGKTVWEWDDTRLPLNDNFSYGDGYFIDNNRIMINAGRNHYCISTETGQTIWKEKRVESLHSYCSNLGSTFFVSGTKTSVENPKLYTSSIFQANTLSASNFREIVKPNYDHSYIDANTDLNGFILKATPIIIENDTLLVIPFNERGPQSIYSRDRSFIGLYNLSKKKWIYDRVQVSEPLYGGNAINVIVDNQKIYLTIASFVACFDLMTGQKRWSIHLQDMNSAINNLILVDGILVAGSLSATLYGINTMNGSPVWSKDVGVINSKLHSQNGVVYCIADENLKAIEVATGKLLWDMPSPDIKLNKISDSWFQGFVTGVPAKDGKKGKIIATTDHSIYCFEAVK